MKSAINQTTLSDQPPGNVTAGIDWAIDDHAVSVVDAKGHELARTMIAHTAAS